MNTVIFDSDDRQICALCYQPIEPEQPKVVIGSESEGLEIYHKTCYDSENR